MAKAKQEAVKAPESGETINVPVASPEPAVVEIEPIPEPWPDPIQPPYISPRPTLGRVVIFKLSEQNAAEINRRRTTPFSIGERIKLNWQNQVMWPLGAQAHIGSTVKCGDELPAMVVYIEPEDGYVNLQVFLDGNDVYWAQSVEEGDSEGQWHWPPRV